MRAHSILNRFIFYFILILPFISFSQNLINVEGTVVDSNNLPISGVTILVKGTNNGTVTDFEGNYTLRNVADNSILVVSSVGYSNKEFALEGKSKLDIALKDDLGMEKVVVVVAQVSTRNYWIGAKIGYNFIGDTDDNFFVGSASLGINLIDGLNKKHTFGVIGNIGNFKFDKSEEDNNDIKKLAQSINGIAVGLGYTHETEDIPIFNNNGVFIFRQFVQTGVRMTTFDNVGVEDDTETLAQSATTAGLEVQISGFKNKGALTFSTGLSLYLFDQNIYQKIFDEQKGSLVTFDMTVILPIAEKVGFFMNGTFSKNVSAAFIMGMIIKP